VFMLRLWSSPDRRDTGLALALLAHAEKRACTIGREEGADSVTLSPRRHLCVQRRGKRSQSDFALLSTYEKMELALNEPSASPGAGCRTSASRRRRGVFRSARPHNVDL
jgi:hypothetical protein